MIRNNVVMLTGRATKDVELKDVGSSKVATIRLAINERIKQRDGEYKEKTVYIDAECWAQRAEYAAENIKKGTIVYVMGKLEQDEWGEGENRRQKHKIYVSHDLQIDRYTPNKEGATATAGATTAGGASASSDGDLPF
ncbi:single-stranded DNA-binding protein [Candidatus Bathyarchaeota archaeon]|nr:MAG: single-stranded DNA-binding protein [Candidatus Bathyarchaeota archaeon]